MSHEIITYQYSLYYQATGYNLDYMSLSIQTIHPYWYIGAHTLHC